MRALKAAVCVSLFIAGLSSSAAVAVVDISMVTVGDPGNAADSTGFGAVGYYYKIGRFDVTTSQYCAFLNAVAKTDTYGLYNAAMADITVSAKGCNIRRTGTSVAYVYTVGSGLPADVANWGNRPVNYVSWGDAARFCNWLTHGQPAGGQDASTTEGGSYTLNGATTDAQLATVARSGKTRYVIPSQDEWYKAAYYDPNKNATPGYWSFPTRSDSTPSNVLDASGTNSANFIGGSPPSYTIGSQYYRTEVGAFAKSASYYGTYDQAGNVWQWNEAVYPLDSNYRVKRGGSFASISSELYAAYSTGITPSNEADGTGFRIAEVPLSGDPNSDGLINDNDLTAMMSCGSGPEIPYAGNCAWADFDADSDVDSIDFGIFQSLLGSGIPIVATSAASKVTSETSDLGGNVIDIGKLPVTERGICWNTSGMPTKADAYSDCGGGAGHFTKNLTGFTPGMKYYVRAYALNAVGIAYGDQKVFTASALPTISTTGITNILGNAATSSGNITFQGTHPVKDRGVCWNITPLFDFTDPTTKVTHDGTGIGIFTSNLTGLNSGATYYVRAYATSDAGTAFGDELTFTTATLPTVTTAALITDITGYSAKSGGTVTSDGILSVTFGVCWNTTGMPTTANPQYTTYDVGTGNITFTSQFTGLSPNTTYYIRAYATNSLGTVYGEQRTFKTLAIPTVTTSAITEVTGASAKSGGNVTSTGNATVTVRGVCWSTVTKPTTADAYTENGSGLDGFTSELTPLSMGTTYYVRAYATNSVGTAYGSERVFTTPVLPIVTTTAVTYVTGTVAAAGGEVTFDGNAPVTERGVCWSTNAAPTVDGAKTNSGTDTGGFISILSNLIPSTTYYVRAYATNAAGSAYGEQVTLTTTSSSPYGMALISAGPFDMGNMSLDPNEGYSNEKPVHTLNMDAFSIKRSHVTNQEYAARLNWALAQGGLIQVIAGMVYKAGASTPYCSTNSAPIGYPYFGEYSQIIWDADTSTFSAIPGKEDYPMVVVSWYGSAAYANWLSAEEGKPLFYDLSTTPWTCNWTTAKNSYRLPTEAEWEKAARGGEGMRFPWSGDDTIQHARANYYSSALEYDTSAPPLGYHPSFSVDLEPFTNPVGYFAPNAFDLYDMAGNVYQWCNDWYGFDYYNSYAPAEWPANPQGPDSGDYRIIRGGSWDSTADNARCSYRNAQPSGVRYNVVGFRIAIKAE